jgi:hypothetical protein
MAHGPVELFRAFRDLVRQGLAATVDVPGVSPGGGAQ